MIPTTRWIALLGLVALGLVLGPARVSAHAAYDHSAPGRNEVLQQAPARVDVWFKQEVFKREGANFVRVFDEQEAQVSEGDGIVDDDDRTHVYTALPGDLLEGLYIVRWFTTSDEDGDTDNGAFCFSVGVDLPQQLPEECAGDEPEPTPTAAAATPTESAVEATRTGLPAGATPTAEVTPDGADEDDGGVPTAAVVGGAIAGVAVLVVVVGAVAVWLRRTLA